MLKPTPWFDGAMVRFKSGAERKLAVMFSSPERHSNFSCDNHNTCITFNPYNIAYNKTTATDMDTAFSSINSQLSTFLAFCVNFICNFPSQVALHASVLYATVIFIVSYDKKAEHFVKLLKNWSPTIQVF